MKPMIRFSIYYKRVHRGIMKTSVALLFGLAIGSASCNKECEIKNPACNEVAPSDEVCAASFQRWFYNKKKNACEQVSYSGCEHYGFSTKQECESCKCK
jgi:hypothetical protein